MKFKNIDYMLVNSTNEFLLEYTPLEENDCYALTNFSGGVGDALICPDGRIKLFVDGRFHTQADLEVDLSKVDVIKLNIGQSQDETICEMIEPNSRLGINTKKVSQNRFEFFEKMLGVINVKLVPVSGSSDNKKFYPSRSTVIVDKNLRGRTFKEKLKLIEYPTLITNSEELSYLTGIRCFNQDFAVKIDGKLLILKDKAFLFTDYSVDENSDFQVMKLDEFDSFIKQVDEKIYVDKSSITAYDYSLIKNKEARVSNIIMLKSIKTKEEIEHLKHCFKMTDKALTETRETILFTDGLSEYDIEQILEQNFRKYGAKSLSFKSIIARNKNSALPHYSTNSKSEFVTSGDLVLIDCGAYYEGGLATDITRVFVKGEPSDLHRVVYTTVLKMFLNAFNYKVTLGSTNGFDIDEFTRKFLEKNSIDGFSFSHGLGHGIGVCVHEAPPNLSKNNIAKTILQNNMCFTIEPGLYDENTFGVRLENSCYLEEGIIKSFSKMCYEKKLIDYTMLSDDEKKWLKEFEVK
jgi:Xaa-Pro aminopeptidase